MSCPVCENCGKELVLGCQAADVCKECFSTSTVKDLCIERDKWEARAEKAEAEVARLRGIEQAAKRCVQNPAWSGVCDEDVELERALERASRQRRKEGER